MPGLQCFFRADFRGPWASAHTLPIPLAQPSLFTFCPPVGSSPFCPRVFACLFTQNASLIPQPTPLPRDLRPLYPSRPCFHDRLVTPSTTGFLTALRVVNNTTRHVVLLLACKFHEGRVSVYRVPCYNLILHRKKKERKKVKSQSCPTLCDPMDCSLPGSFVHGIFQARILGGLPFPSPGDLPNSGIEPGCPALQADALPSEPPGKP